MPALPMSRMTALGLENPATVPYVTVSLADPTGVTGTGVGGRLVDPPGGGETPGPAAARCVTGSGQGRGVAPPRPGGVVPRAGVDRVRLAAGVELVVPGAGDHGRWLVHPVVDVDFVPATAADHLDRLHARPRER